MEALRIRKPGEGKTQLSVGRAAQPRVDAQSAMQWRYESLGLVCVRNLFSPELMQQALDVIQLLTCRSDADFPQVMGGQLPRVAMPSMVTRTPQLWPMIMHRGLLDCVKTCIGDDAKFVHGDGVFAHFSGEGWHRDTAWDLDAGGPAWDPHWDRYRHLRVLLFLHDRFDGYRFAFKPGSHRFGAKPLQAHGYSFDDASQQELWVTANPGDALIFDARLLHRGEELSKPRYGMTLTYGPEDAYNVCHHYHERAAREDQQSTGGPISLRQELSKHNLLLNCTTDTEGFEAYRNHWRGEKWKKIPGRILD